MLSKEEIECCKTEARNYIEFRKTKDNLGWAKGLLWYIEHLEVKNNDLRKSVEQIYDGYQDIGKIAFDYSDKIEQLESDKQKLIELLEKANKEDTDTVKYYEKQRRLTTDDFYKKSYQTQIHKANSRREVRKNILEIVKGENQVTVK